MADINLVVLVGRLTRDAELKYTPSGMALSKFSLAINRRIKQGDQWKDEANFFDVTLWGKTAENLNQYLTKGKQVAVEGELRQNRWGQDGQTRSKVEIMAHSVQLLGGGNAQGGAMNASASKPWHGAAHTAAPQGDDFPDDIPF
jgi:single-strand DNA-binding protein